MIIVKNKASLRKMELAGELLADLFSNLSRVINPGMSTADIDDIVVLELRRRGLVTKTKGYMGYQHSCCVSVNDEVVHGVPDRKKILQQGDLVKVDICAALNGYCADMARCYFVGGQSARVCGDGLVEAAMRALEAGVQKAVPGARLSDISAAIQSTVEAAGFGIVRDFAGHGIGRAMHEEPEILNYGEAGKGPILRAGMTFAIEPMITEHDWKVRVDSDGWTARTVDGGWAAHVEDTIVVTVDGPVFLTRQKK